MFFSVFNHVHVHGSTGSLAFFSSWHADAVSHFLLHVAVDFHDKSFFLESEPG